MDGELREALEHAKGRSEYIFAVVADIRGFSEFSRGHDSREVATYVKRVYIELIDRYFPFAKFYKATGDGLLIAIPFEDDSLRETAQRTVDACVKCVSEFADVCKSDPMVNFPTPDKIGFGVAWGAACCLASADNSVLDYSGHLLNLASRLMDLARPLGIVLDGAFGVELLVKKTQDLFVAEEVYLRSVAEEEPIRVYILKGVVEIPDAAKRPIRPERWEVKTDSLALREWRRLASQYRIPLDRCVKHGAEMIVEIRHRKRHGGKVVKGMQTRHRIDREDYKYQVVGGVPSVLLDRDGVLAYAESKSLPPAEELEVRINYVAE